MPSQQLVDLVHRLKNSGIKISFTTPRSKTMIHLREDEESGKTITDRVFVGKILSLILSSQNQ